MPKTFKEALRDLQEALDHVVSNDTIVDYVAIFETADVAGVDIVRTKSKYRDPDRPYALDKITGMIELERQSFALTPYDEDKLINGKKHIYRFCPTGIDDLILMFVSHNKFDDVAFRMFCQRHRPVVVEKLRELRDSQRR